MDQKNGEQYYEHQYHTIFQKDIHTNLCICFYLLEKICFYILEIFFVVKITKIVRKKRKFDIRVFYTSLLINSKQNITSTTLK